jgi:hypothetical protein
MTVELPQRLGLDLAAAEADRRESRELCGRRDLQSAST